MSLTVRVLLGVCAIALAGYFFVMPPVLARVERQYLEAAEEIMVDAAEVCAAVASEDVAAGRSPAHTLSRAFGSASRREISAKIYSIEKTGVTLNAYVTDAAGRVLFDSAHPENVGQDFSQKRDVHRTLTGRYGARATLDKPDDPLSYVMYVSAPVRSAPGESLAGVVSVYKPQRTLTAFVYEARRYLRKVALATLIGVLLAGLLLSHWVTRPLDELKGYALAVSRGERPKPPRPPGRHLRVLAEAVDRMRDALEGRKYVEDYVQSMTHEMKSPIAAIGATAELLHEDLPPGQRAKFLDNLRNETERLQRLVARLLALSSLESRKSLEKPEVVDLSSVVRRACKEAGSRAAAANVAIHFEGADPMMVAGDEFLLESAIDNLIQNAIEFSPPGGAVSVKVISDDGTVSIVVEDEGQGIPVYALDRVFDRFYSLPRPGTGRKSTGLGLCFVRETALLHGGGTSLANRRDRQGVRATLTLPVKNPKRAVGSGGAGA